MKEMRSPPKRLNRVEIAGQLTSVTNAGKGIEDYCLFDFPESGVFLTIRNVVSGGRVAYIPVFVESSSVADFPNIEVVPPIYIKVEGSLSDKLYLHENSLEQDRIYYVFCKKCYQSRDPLCLNSVKLVGRVTGSITTRPSKSYGGYTVVSVDKDAIREDMSKLKEEAEALSECEKEVADKAMARLVKMKLRDCFNDDDDFLYMRNNYGNYFDVVAAPKVFINYHLAHTTEEDMGPLIRVAQLTSRADFKQRGYKCIKDGDLAFVDGILNSDHFEGHSPSIRLKVFVMDSGFRRKIPNP